MLGILFDLDLTLIDSSSAASLRKKRQWREVYRLIPHFQKYEGIDDMLMMLTQADVPLGIVTSSPELYCSQVLQAHQINITTTVCYHDTARHKPFHDPITRGIELLGLLPDQVWSVGDDPKDIQATRSAGAHAIGVTWGMGETDDLHTISAEQVFDQVTDLHAFLETLVNQL